MKKRIIAAASIAAIAAACTPIEPVSTGPVVDSTGVTVAGEPTSGEIGRATMLNPAGQTVGDAVFYKNGTAIALRAGLSGQPGTYALHIHDVGTCTAPGFESAGPHWNPTGRQHGLNNPAGHHKGDTPNITIGADGRATVSYRIENANALGATGLFDANGASIVMHAQADDNVSDPAGNAGARIACGVIQPVR